MDRKEISRRILDLTLEIISLLSGEDYTIVKKTSGGTPIIHESGGWSRTPITEPPPLIHEQKILELTHKMMELLTGEVPKKYQDVAASVSVEKQEPLEGHKDLYMDTIMEDPQPLMKPDSDSSRRNPPERCPRPLYSQDCPEEKPPENHQMTNQGEDVTDIKVEEEEERMMVDPPCKSEVEEDIPVHVTTENPSKNSEGNAMLSQDYKVEDDDILQRSSGEDLISCNVHPGLNSADPSYKYPNREEPSSNQLQIVTTSPDLLCNPPNREEPSPDQSQMVTTSPDLLHIPPIQKEPTSDQSQMVTISPDLSHIPPIQKEPTSDQSQMVTTSPDLSHIPPNQKEPTCDQSQMVTTSPDLSHIPPIQKEPTSDQSQIVTTSPDLSHNPPNQKEPTSDQSQIVTTSTGQKGGKSFQCEECGKQFTKSSNLYVHKRIHAGEKSCSRSERGKCFTQMSNLVKQEKIHTGEKPYPCSECGKGFFSKSNLLVHQRSHTGDKPITGSESVKCFTKMSSLVSHEKIHTGVKPFMCSECGKVFFSKTNLIFHQKIHRG